MPRSDESPAADDPPFIVAEIVTNWPKPWPVEHPDLLSAKFEQVIEHNRRRGYRLFKFDVSRVMVTAENLNETIIAVFEKTEEVHP